jgi:hypothetical protein
MRNLVLSALALAALVACGPSSKEVATAKSARYQGDKLELFANVKTATEAKYKVMKSDETSLGLQTEARWFSPEGLAVTPRGDNDMRDVPDKSVHIALVVTMLPDGSNWVVKVTPMLERWNIGIPKPEPLKEGDASLPGWVQGKVDELAMAIHSQLAKFEVKSVPQMVPAAPATAPAPDEPTAGSAAPAPAPAEGSAAGSAATP